MLEVTLTYNRAPHSTEFWQVGRGVEELYYALLFANGDLYSGRKPWESWIRMGFSAGVRQAPAAAEVTDRLHVSMRTNAKTVTATASGGHAGTVDQLGQLLSRIEELREPLKVSDGEDRAAKLMVDGTVGEALQGVAKSVKAAGISGDGAAQIDAALRRALSALTYPDIDSVEIARN